MEKYKTERVCSWLYQVINPVIEGLKTELSFLERRYNVPKDVHRIGKYIQPASMHILRDLNYVDGLLKDMFEQHDDLVIEIIAAEDEKNCGL